VQKKMQPPHVVALGVTLLLAVAFSPTVIATIDDTAAPPIDVVLWVQWEAPTTAQHLARIVPPDPTDVVDLYKAAIGDEYAITIVLTDHSNSSHTRWDGRTRSDLKHYHTAEHPVKLRARRTAVVDATMYNIFDQFRFEDPINIDGAMGSGRRLQGASRHKRATPAPKTPKTALAELQQYTDTIVDSIRDEVLRLQETRMQEGLDGASARGRKLQSFRGIQSSATGSPSSASTTVPTLKITLLQNIPIKSNAATGEWHLDRIDQPTLPLNGGITLPPDVPNANTSDQSWIYVVDGGIRATHTELHPRVSVIYNEYPQLSTSCDNHGTHVASLAAGKTTGVNPKASVFDVRVLNCDGDGSFAALLRGLAEINEHCAANGGGSKRSIVINMSLGGASPAYSAEGRALAAELSEARQNCDAVIVAAAGNYATDSCTFIPASLVGTSDGGVVTIGASTITDQLATYSNYGKCVAVHAPGTNLRSAVATSDSAYGLLSGTSMASPVVAGIASLHTARRPLWYNTFPVQLYADVVYHLMVTEQSSKNRIALSGAATYAETTRSLVQVPALLEDTGSGEMNDIIVVIPPPATTDRATPPDTIDDGGSATALTTSDGITSAVISSICVLVYATM